MKKYFLLLAFGFILTAHAQKAMKGFFQAPHFVAKTAVDSTFFAYGTDFLNYGEMATHHKIVIWNSGGDIIDEIDLTFLEKYNFRNEIYTGQLKSCMLSNDKKEIIVVGNNYQFKGNRFETIIFAYSLELKKWKTLYASKEINCTKLIFHPSHENIIIADATLSASTGEDLWKIMAIDISRDTVLQTIKTYKYPNIPTYLKFSKDGSRLFVFDGLITEKGFMDVFQTSNYRPIKRIPFNEHILQVFETDKELYFSGTKKSYVYNQLDLKHRQTLNFNTILGVFPMLNFILFLDYNTASQSTSNAFYNLKTRKRSSWASGQQVLQLYDPETKIFIAFDYQEFFTYDANYKRTFNPPSLSELRPSVYMHKMDLETVLK